jgi:hypothetical protein
MERDWTDGDWNVDIAGIDASDFLGHFKSQPQSGERLLLLQVMRDAIAVVTGRQSAPRCRQREAAAWFQESAYDWPFAFENICDVYNWDANRIRRSLSREIEQAAQGKVRLLRQRPKRGGRRKKA